MSRKLQHIAFENDANAARKNGKKVVTLCGAKVYQIPDMKLSIPTCTPCARAQIKKYNDLILGSRVRTWNYGA